MPTKSELIERLISDDIGIISQGFECGDHYFLDLMLRDGFKGYNHCKKKEIEKELKERDIKI